MARQKTPLTKARLTGADKAHPERFRNRAEPSVSAPIGDPPAWMDSAAKTAWRTFCKELPWLTGADRAILSSASIMRAMQASGQPLTAAHTREFRAHLAALGATPVDRQKIQADRPDEEDDPFAIFDDNGKPN